MISRVRRRTGKKENQSGTLVNEFLACQHLLSDEEILEFISGGEQLQDGDSDKSNNMNQRVTEAWIQYNRDSRDEQFHLRRAFRRRVAEIRKLAANLRNGQGGARIDEDGRLVPVTEPPQPPRADLPPVGGNVNNNPNANNNLQFNQQQQQQMENQEELLMAQKLREAEFTVEHAVRELRRKNVPEEDFEVILLDHRGRPRVAPQPGVVVAQNNNEGDHDNQTLLMFPGLQRLAFGCFTMVALIVVITLKVLPISSIINMNEAIDKTFDPLLNQVLVARNWNDHVRDCSGGLTNRSASHYNSNLFHRIQQSLLYGNTTTDCSDGVLHIPSKRVLYSEMEVGQWRVPGLNVSWFMPCSERTFESNLQETSSEECPSLSESKDDVQNCAEQRKRDRCFRGIHDDFAGRMEIDAALKMGDYLIGKGGDHFDIHDDPRYLFSMVPSIVKKMSCLLDTTYLNQHEHSQETTSYGECLKSNTATTANIRPVAFRVLTTGPMDGHDVKLKQEKGDKMTMYLTQSTALNESNYLKWVLKSRKHNDKARYQTYYRPWFYRLQPKRETCDLKYDLQADSRFCIQTSLYLTNGAGEDYWGGTDLFVDDHPSNFANPSERIARGTSIDGTKGRLVVSTGGFENLQCRFPTRAGFRSVLQIWWEC